MKRSRCGGGIRVAAMVGMMMAAGCSSYRIMTTMKAPKGLPADKDAVQFRIAEAAVLTPTNVASGGTAVFGIYMPADELIRDKLAQMAVERYPRIFTDAAGGIPLKVTITRSGYAMDMGGDACVSCLTLTILPLRSSDRTDFQVDVATVPAKEIAGLTAVTFSREETSWLSMFPTGWVPVPGGSGERCWGTDSALSKTETLMLESTVDAVVTLLRRVDAAAWGSVPAKP